MKNLINKLLTGTLVLSTVGRPEGYQINYNNTNLEKATISQKYNPELNQFYENIFSYPIEKEKPSWNLDEIRNSKIPALNKKIKVPSQNCAKYARLVGKKEYNKTYAPTHSWNRIYHDTVISMINGQNSQDYWKNLDTLAMTGELEPGMIVGFYYKNSKEANKKDEKGKKRIATHNAIYRGTEVIYDKKTGKEDVVLVFDHQWGTKIERITSRDIKGTSKEKILYPTYVVDAY